MSRPVPVRPIRPILGPRERGWRHLSIHPSISEGVGLPTRASRSYKNNSPPFGHMNTLMNNYRWSIDHSSEERQMRLFSLILMCSAKSVTSNTSSIVLMNPQTRWTTNIIQSHEWGSSQQPTQHLTIIKLMSASSGTIICYYEAHSPSILKKPST